MRGQREVFDVAGRIFVPRLDVEKTLRCLVGPGLRWVEGHCRLIHLYCMEYGVCVKAAVTRCLAL